MRLRHDLATRSVILACLIRIAWASSAQAGWAPLLRTAEYYGEGSLSGSNVRCGSPYGIASADFNGDGRPDFVLADTPPGQPNALASVITHDSHSAYSPMFDSWSHVFPGTADSGLGVAVADFNLDGKPDLVFAPKTYPDPFGDVWISMGTGGGFKLASGSALEYSSGLVAAGDVNNDGIPDAVVGEGSTTFGVEAEVFFLNANSNLLESGGFYRADANPTTDPNIPMAPHALSLADATGDGILDVVLTDYNQTAGPCMWILKGDNSGAFNTVLGPFALSAISKSVTVARLNGDAIPDIAVAEGTAQQIRILFGTGGGAFLSPTIISLSHEADQICAGDVDGDGDIDLASLSGLLDNVRSAAILRNNGDGTVAAPSYSGGLPGNGQAVLVDVNEDGRLDLVASTYGNGANSNPHTMGVLLNDGSGGFPSLVQTGPFSTSNGVAIADFNGDGVPDIANASSNLQQVDIGIGNGSGSFSPVSSIYLGFQPTMVAAADLNRDGKMDLAVCVQGQIHLYEGDGFGSFVFRAAYDGVLYPSSFVDMNRDGRLDIVANNSGNLFVYVQTSDWSFDPRASVNYPGWYIDALAVGDWNRDGMPDLAVATTVGVHVISGTPSGDLSIGASMQTNRSYTSLCAGDFNRDGVLDLAARENVFGLGALGTTRGIDILLGSSAGTFALYRSLGTLEQRGSTIGSWDANLDGIPDLIASGSSDGPGNLFSSVDVLLGGGSGDFGLRTSYSLGVIYPIDSMTNSIVAGDVDRNGVPDLVAGAMETILATPPSRGIGLQDASYYSTLNNPARVALGDLNRDGKLDAVVATVSGSPGVAVSLGASGGTLGTSTPLAQSWFTGSVALGDFNRDGKLDIAASNSGFGAPRVSTMLGLGDGTFGPRNDFFINAGNDFEVGDMDRDGIPDIVTATQDSICVLRGIGNGFFFPIPLARVAITPVYDLDVADLNGDRFLDVAVASGSVKVIYGGPNGSLSAPVTLSPSLLSCQTICVADVTRDGFVDIIANDGGNFYVLRGSPFSPFSTYTVTTLPFGAFDLQVGNAAANGIPYVYVARPLQQLELLSVSPSGSLTDVGSAVAVASPMGLALGDMNRDGVIDAVTVGQDGSAIAVNLHGPNAVTAVATTSQVVPAHPSLRQNYPNPFNPETRIRYELPSPQRVQVAVFDVQGRLVAKLEDAPESAGEHAVRWDGRTRDGAQAASGVYFYRLTTSGGYSESKPMVMVK